MSNSWLDYPTTSNLFKQSYIKDFIDISGDVYIRNGNINGINADISMNGTLTCNSLTLTESNGAGINSDVQTALNTKQNALIIGSGISLVGNTLNVASSTSNISSSSVSSYSSTFSQVGNSPSLAIAMNSGFGGARIILSGDGQKVFVSDSIAEVNAAINNAGVIYVYELVNNVWTRKGPALNTSYPLTGEAGGDSIGQYDWGMTSSYDGTIFAISKNWQGGPNYVKVFNVIGNTITQRGSTLRGGTGFQRLGNIIKLTDNGNRLFASTWENTPNHIRVYDWNGSDWVLSSAFNIGNSNSSIFGINSNGTTVAVGFGANSSVSVYDLNGATWTIKGAKINTDQPGTNNYFGHAVYLNSDGTKFAAQANKGNLATSYILAFEWNGSAWVQRGSRITDIDVNGGINGMSADGDTILGRKITNGREARVYKWNGTAWARVGTNTMSMYDGLSISNDGSVVATSNHPTQTFTIYKATINDVSTTAFSGNLDISGNLDVSGGDIIVSGSTVHSSDIRLKSNIDILKKSLDVIMKLNPEIYDKTNPINTLRESGFIAQDIWYNIPELRHLVVLPDGVNAEDIQDMSFNRVKPKWIDMYDISTNGIIDVLRNQIMHVNEDQTITYEEIIDPNDYTDKTPNYEAYGWSNKPASINYEGLIAYLVGAMNELKEKIMIQSIEIDNLVQ